MGQKSAQLLFGGFRAPRGFLGAVIIDLIAAGNDQVEPAVGCDADAFDVHTVGRADHHMSVRRDLFDRAVKADGIKALGGELRPVGTLAGDDQRDALVRRRHAPGDLPVCFHAHIQVRVGDQKHIIGGKNSHKENLLETGTLKM